MTGGSFLVFLLIGVEFFYKRIYVLAPTGASSRGGSRKKIADKENLLHKSFSLTPFTKILQLLKNPIRPPLSPHTPKTGLAKSLYIWYNNIYINISAARPPLPRPPFSFVFFCFY